MRFNAATRTRLLVDVTSDIEPTGSTIEVKVDETWHEAEWIGEPTAASSRWTQTARTIDYFAGPDAAAAGATILATARHLTKARVTKGGDILVADATPVDVR